MFIISFLILFMTVLFTTLNYKNKFSSVISVYFVAISTMMLFSAFYISKTSQYKYPLQIDYAIYLSLATYPIKLDYLVRFYNLSFALYMFAAVYGTRALFGLKFKKLLLLSLPILFFLVFCDPLATKKLYIMLYTSSDIVEKVTGILTQYGNIFCLICLLVYSLMPIAYTFLYYKKIKNVHSKRSALIFGLCVTIINFFVNYFFVFGIFKNILFFNVNHAKLPITSTITSAYIVVPIFLMFSMITIMIMLVCYKPFNLFDIAFIRKNDIEKNSMELNKNLSMNLHIYKNAFWGMEQQFELIKKACSSNDHEGVMEYANNGIFQVREQLSTLNRAINMLKSETTLLENTDLLKCIETAMEKTCTKNLEIFTLTSNEPKIIIYGNKNSLTEVFYNLFINSIESISINDVKNPRININVSLDDNLCMIEITDNGYGIPKKELKNIVKPFHSTKPRLKNSGIGLSYVKSVIKSQHGKIAVISEVGKFTSFHIALPILKNSR